MLRPLGLRAAVERVDHEEHGEEGDRQQPPPVAECLPDAWVSSADWTDMPPFWCLVRTGADMTVFPAVRSLPVR